MFSGAPTELAAGLKGVDIRGLAVLAKCVCASMQFLKTLKFGLIIKILYGRLLVVEYF